MMHGIGNNLVKDIMLTPFKNDMFSMMYKAFKNLYPDKVCEIWWDTDLENRHEGKTTIGDCSYCEDGRVYVDISVNLTVLEAAETLIHELAHVALGEENPSHDEEWEQARQAIIEEYNKMYVKGNNNE